MNKRCETKSFNAIDDHMGHKRSRKREPRRDLNQEIADTESKPMHETVPISLRILRSLYLHALKACRDGDYANPAQYISDLIRRDKHVQNAKPPTLEYPHQSVTGETPPVHPIGPPLEPPGRVGFEEKFRPFGATEAKP